MNWISITFFLIAFLVFCTLFKRGADIISPARVFGFTWSIVFGLANLKLSGLQHSWTLSDWVYALMGPSSFLLGLFAACVMAMGRQLHPVNKMRQILKNQDVNEARLFYLTIAAFTTYLVGYFIVYLVKGHVPIFAPNPGMARTDFFIFGIGLFLHNMPFVLFFSIVYLLLVPDSRGRKWILKAVVFITVLSYVFLLQRYQLIMVAVIAFALLYYATQYIRFRTVALFVALGIAVIYSISTIRVGQLLQFALYKGSLMKFSPEYAIITEPYMYLVMNVENFVHSVNKLDHYSFGYHTFDWVFALIQLKYPIREYFGVVETPYLFSGYNTYTLFWTFYRDFGVFGISIVPLILGLVVGSLYYAMRRNPTIELVSYYSIIVFVMGLSFFINLLGFLWFVYIITWMVLILKLVRVKDSKWESGSAAHFS